MENLPKLLSGKNIVLGVCGSISIYKSLEIIRNLQKLGANVRVVMSKGAHDFIKPLLFEAISHFKVLTQDTQSWGEIPHNHVEIAKWADAFLIAPISANSLNKIAYGIADNVLLESFLAFDKIKLLAPAANTNMLENQATQESLKILKQRNITIIQPQCKELACQTIGNGALAEPIEIIYQTLRCILRDSFWEQCNVCVSGGGSKEAIDSVRFLSNFSSGKMGANLALAAYLLGAKVTFVGSVIPFTLPLEITLQNTQSSQDYLNAITQWQSTQNLNSKNYLFMSAAISDYIPQTTIQGKLKKQEIGDSWQLDLKQNKDILATIKKSKNQKIIGFKLESQSKDSIQSAQTTLNSKGLDAICLNTISTTHNPLDSNNNQILWMDSTFSKDLGFCDKLELAFKILQQARNL